MISKNAIWVISPNVLKEVLEQVKLENKGLGDISALLSAKAQETQSAIEGKIAVIPIFGPLQKTGNIFSRLFRFTSYDVLTQDISRCIMSDAVNGIILDIDSPGGEVNGCSELAQLIAEGTKYKPIIAYGSGDIASGAYWIASAATKIIASETSSVGSIGVVGVYNKKDNDELEIVSSQSPLKRVDPETEEGKTHIQARIDDIADVFIGAVAKNRRTTKEKVISDFGGGDVLIGEKAVNAGLIDGIGTLSSIIDCFDNENFKYMDENKLVAQETQGFSDGFMLGKANERERVLAILEKGHMENVSKDFLKTAIETDLALETVEKLLKTAPKEEKKAVTSFEKAIGAIENPKIDSSIIDSEEDFNALAKAIAQIN